jgi:hypothetical protein
MLDALTIRKLLMHEGGPHHVLYIFDGTDSHNVWAQ